MTPVGERSTYERTPLPLTLLALRHDRWQPVAAQRGSVDVDRDSGAAGHVDDHALGIVQMQFARSEVHLDLVRGPIIVRRRAFRQDLYVLCDVFDAEFSSTLRKIYNKHWVAPLWNGTACGRCRKVFHYPQLTQTFENSRAVRIIHSQMSSLIPPKNAQSPA